MDSQHKINTILANHYYKHRHTKHPQSTNTTSLTITDKLGYIETVNSPRLPDLEKLTTGKKIQALRSHLLSVLGHILSTTHEGRRYVIHGGTAMAFHLYQKISPDGVPDYNLSDEISTLLNYSRTIFPPTSSDQYYDIDLSINDPQPTIDELFNCLKKTLNENDNDNNNDIELIVTQPKELYGIYIATNNKQKQYCIARTRSIIANCNNKTLLKIDINFAPESELNSTNFFNQPHNNQAIWDVINFCEYPLQVQVCSLEQLITNYQTAYVNTYFEGVVANNKYLDKLQCVENLIKSNILRHKTDNLTTVCTNLITTLRRPDNSCALQANKKLQTITLNHHAQPVYAESAPLSNVATQVPHLELKDNGINTFTPTFTEQGTNTTTQMKDNGINTSKPALSEKNTNTIYPELESRATNTCIQLKNATTNTDSEDNKNTNLFGNTTLLNLSPYSSDKEPMALCHKASQTNPHKTQEASVNTYNSTLTEQQSDKKHSRMQEQGTNTNRHFSKNKETETTVSHQNNKGINTTSPKIKSKGINTDGIPQKTRSTQTEAEIPTPVTALKFVHDHCLNLSELSSETRSLDSDDDDDENQPIPIDILWPRNQKIIDMTPLILHKATQTDAIPSITDSEKPLTSSSSSSSRTDLSLGSADKPRSASPDQETKDITTKELMARFKDKLLALTSPTDSNNHNNESIAFYYQEIEELIDIYELLITPGTTWIAIADTKYLQGISSNINKLLNQIYRLIDNEDNPDCHQHYLDFAWALSSLTLISYQAASARFSLISYQDERQLNLAYMKAISNLTDRIIDNPYFEKTTTFKNSDRIRKYLEINYTTITEIFQKKYIIVNQLDILIKIIRILIKTTTTEIPDFILSYLTIYHSFYRYRVSDYILLLPMARTGVNRLFRHYILAIFEPPMYFAEQLYKAKISPSNFLKMQDIYTWLADLGMHQLAAVILLKYLALINNSEPPEYFFTALKSNFTKQPNQTVINQIYQCLTCPSVNHPVNADTQYRAQEKTKIQLMLFKEMDKCYDLFRHSKKLTLPTLKIDDPQLKNRLDSWQQVQIVDNEASSWWCTVL